jgi:glutaredoxin
MTGMARTWLVAAVLCALGCGNPPSDGAQAAAVSGTKAQVKGERVTPPFAVRGELEGLLLVWYDADGAAHTAARRSDIPDSARARVRIDSLELAPEQKLDPAYVYVADLTKASSNGDYGVEKWRRDDFEALVLPVVDKPRSDGLAASGSEVIIYGASWCGACKEAAKFLTERGVPFVEKDIEKEPAARTEMLEKARRQGVSTQGIPVIDVRGTLLPGFDPGRIDALLARGG